LTGASVYYYVLDEYKVSNELLTEDIYVSLPSPPLHACDTMGLVAASLQE